MNLTVRAPRILLVGILTLAALVALPPGRAEAAPADIKLTRVNTSSGLISGLDSALPNKKVSDVIHGANRTGTACTAPVSNRAASFCWQSGDNTVRYWMPQGLTTSADATATGVYDGKQVLISSWYDNGTNGTNRGVRLSFVDMSNTTTPKYRHVLLVEPTGTASTPSFKQVKSHAGGLAWYGNLLYVCDTFGGMRVFDMRHILAVSTGSSSKIGRQSDGTYHGLNYAYVMPQVAKYVPSTSGGVAPLRYSQVSVDRTSTPDSLVVSEYGYPGDGTRIVRFNVDSDGAITLNADGVGHADWAYTVSFRSMQGATAINGTYYVHRSNGDSSKGGMIKWTPGNYAEVKDGTLPIGPEDLSYWGAKNQLWSQTEYPGKRYVFASRASAW